MDTGSLIQLGNLSLKNLRLQDLAPTYMRRKMLVIGPSIHDNI